MGRTYTNRSALRATRTNGDDFRCRHCRLMVGVLPSGGRHRNHCPYCLYSRHLDERRPGDRASDCGASMPPVAAYTRRNGEWVLVHECGGCGVQRYNRIAADDDFELVLRLPLHELLPTAGITAEAWVRSA